MAAFEVLISESQERMLAVVRPELEAAVREVCTRWGIPCATIGVVTADGDIAVREAGVEIVRIPARYLTSEAIVHDRLATPPARRRAAPAPGDTAEQVDRLPERGMDPGRRPLGPPRQPEPQLPAGRLRAVRQHGPGQHRRRARPRSRRAPDQGHREGPRGEHRRERRRWARGSLARGRDERCRGDPERLDHRRHPAGGHELPQLRRSDPPRGVLAAVRGGTWPRGCLPGAESSGHRRQRLALQRVAGRGDPADPRDRSRRARRTTSPRSSGPHLWPRATPSSSSARRSPASRAASTPGSAAGPWRTAPRRSTSIASAPCRPSCARRSRAASSHRPRTSAAAAWPSRSPRGPSGAVSGRRSGSRSATRPRWTSSARAPAAS